MNEDGGVDINDIGGIMDIAIGNNVTPLKNVIGDCNFDGITDGFDAAEVDRYLSA